ncbi:6-bladed beta-propeller [Candidatus Fermentibacteria bacterium]|nr:6-bladed beta-propeller [Candidatus Fermentibacteria bacterium]
MKSLAVAIVFLVLAAGCGERAGDESPSQKAAIQIDTLEVIMQIGTDFSDSTTSFWHITDATIDNTGNILVLDRFGANLKMFDGSGEYVRLVARDGNGPGELVMPWDMFMFNDGRLMVLDPGKRGFVVFDDSLRFVEELGLWQQNQPFQSCAASDSQFAAYKGSYDATETELILHRRVALYTYGHEDWDRLLWQDSLVLPKMDVIENRSLLYNNFEEPLTICGDGAGTVYFSQKSGSDYSITGWSVDGEELLDISMDLPPVEKTADELKAESTYVTDNWASRGNVGPEWEYQPEPYKNMIVDIDIGPDGNLWARRGTTPTPFFDIFAPSTGELLGRAVFPDSGWSWKVEVCSNGILAWEEDPESGYQVVYVLAPKGSS